MAKMIRIAMVEQIVNDVLKLVRDTENVDKFSLARELRRQMSFWSNERITKRFRMVER